MVSALHIASSVRVRSTVSIFDDMKFPLLVSHQSIHPLGNLHPISPILCIPATDLFSLPCLVPHRLITRLFQFHLMFNG